MTWSTRALGEVALVQGGKTPNKLDAYLADNPRSDRSVPFYKVGDMNAGATLSTARTLLAPDELQVLGIVSVPTGTVVFPKAGGAIATNKKRTVTVPGPVDLNCMAVTAGPEIEALYLRLWFESFDLTSIADGSVLPQISKRRASELQVPLPPLDEQRRIVDLLEDHLSRLQAAENYLSASRRRLAALERSALDAHFGGPDVPLSDLIEDISAGKSFGAANAPALDGEWGIIKVSAMTWGEFDPTENKAVTSAERVDPRFEIREGDLLVSRANTSAYVGASVLVRQVRPRLLLSDTSMRVTPRAGVESEWLWRALQAPSARRQISALATGTKDSMRNISQAVLKRVLLPNASSDEQLAAMKSFNEVDAAVAVLRREIATGAQRLEALRRSLLAAAFSGRLTGAASEPSAAKEMIDA
jgi:type I restriction enzyme S subunit